MQKVLPILFFTHARTRLACEALRRVVERLDASPYERHFVVCDDHSSKEHLDALRDVLKDQPRKSFLTPVGHGLGASMNRGIEFAVDDMGCDVFFRMEDDWLLERHIPIGHWIDLMLSDSIAAIRMGMLYRDPSELVPYKDGLSRLKSRPDRTFNFNNQVALVHRCAHDVAGAYDERLSAPSCERDFACRFNRATEKGVLTPYVCWPTAWMLNSPQSPALPFTHAGLSELGHTFRIPARYMYLNDPPKPKDKDKE